jgi:hypothetical protein
MLALTVGHASDATRLELEVGFPSLERIVLPSREV